MSYELKLWKGISKKINSTYQVTTQPDYTLNVVLKEDTSLETPTFLLDLDDWEVNYCQFQGHYYFIDDIRRNITGQMEIECTQDILATYKTEIGNYTAFVERAASNYDVQINDDAISQKQTYRIDQNNVNISLSSWIGVLAGGCYLLRVVGNQNLTEAELQHSVGIVSYLVPPWNLLRILDWAFNQNNYSDVFTDAAVKSFFNPFQYIVDVIWMPIEYFSWAGAHPNATRKNVAFGWWVTDIEGIVMPDERITWEGALPTFTTRYNDFRDRNANWTKFKLYVPLVGNVEIDPVDYYANDLYYHYKFDPLLNDGLFTITHGNEYKDRVIYVQQIKFGAKIQIGQIATDLKNAIGSTAAGIASAATGNFYAAGTSLISGALNVLQPTPSINGHLDGRINYYYGMNINVCRYTADAAEVPLTVNGRQLCKNVQISTLSGFIKCAAASVDITGFAGDKDAVNAALNGGFYYE